MPDTPSPEKFEAWVHYSQPDAQNGTLQFCPRCAADLSYWVAFKDEPPRQYYKTVGVEIRGKYDGVLYWAHWGCHAWQRWPESHLLHSVAQPIIEQVNDAWKAE